MDLDQTYEQKSDNFTVTMEYHGEGYDGEYNQQDPSDKPLLRVDIYFRDEDEIVRDGSFCTNIPVGTSQIDVLLSTMLTQLEELFKVHGEDNLGTIIKIMGQYSWYDETSDFKKPVHVNYFI